MLTQLTHRAVQGTRARIISRAQTPARLRAPVQGTSHLAHIARTHSAQSSPNWTLSRSFQQSASQTRKIPAHRPALPSTLFTQPPRRPFTSGRRFNYQYNQYNRFNGPKGGLFFRLVQNAKPRHFVIIGLGVSGVYWYNSDVVSETGRRRFIIVTPQQELNFGAEGYRDILQEERGKILPDHHPLTMMVDRVLRRLIPEAPIQGADWKVHVIKDDGNVNAFVLPGGKVFVYTGILPICGDEDGLAAVLGHEIAHIVARHPAERMSNSFLSLGAVFMISLLFDVSGQFTSLLVNLMYSLPNSRSQEAEADNIGLMMMARACFNPEAAMRIWARMQKLEKMAPPQFMSTHPSSYNREEAIRGWLEKAKNIYEDSGCGSVGRWVPGFHDAYRSHGKEMW